jgi:hypothetical protein
MHDTRNKVIISILSILFVIATVAAIVLFIKNKESNETLVITEQEYKKKIDSLVNESEINEEATKTENATTEKVVEKNVEVAKFVPFDSSKVLNGDSGATYTETQSGNTGILKIKNGKPYIYLKENLSNSYVKGKEYEITGFSKKVVYCFDGLTGQSQSGSMLLFLMEDGTVEYIMIDNIKSTNSLKSQGKIAGLESIVRIQAGSVNFGESGAAAIFAINNKGESYDIANKLK